MSVFSLPDLGEGLTEAEIVEWHVAVDTPVTIGAPLVSVETDKAIVEIPSPRSGQVTRLFGERGDIIHTGDPLVEFDGEATTAATTPRPDTGTVVGEVRAGTAVVQEKPASVGARTTGVKATPAVRALAHRLEVDLSMVTPSGPEGVITAADVQRVHKILSDVGPMEPLRGVRRTMARSMARAHAEVVPVTVCDDADVHAWAEDEDTTVRLVQAIVAACRAEPALNAWYDSHAMGRRLLQKIDLGIAVDTEDGLFAPVLRDVGNRDTADLRRGLGVMREAVRNRTVPPEELRGHTFMLSNFGIFGGRYASPVVVPPAVAIVAAGRIREQVVAVAGTPAVRRMLPLSLTFDHRAVTGGEASRFLAVLMDVVGKTFRCSRNGDY